MNSKNEEQLQSPMFFKQSKSDLKPKKKKFNWTNRDSIPSKDLKLRSVQTFKQSSQLQCSPDVKVSPISFLITRAPNWS